MNNALRSSPLFDAMAPLLFRLPVSRWSFLAGVVRDGRASVVLRAELEAHLRAHDLGPPLAALRTVPRRHAHLLCWIESETGVRLAEVNANDGTWRTLWPRPEPPKNIGAAAAIVESS